MQQGLFNKEVPLSRTSVNFRERRESPHVAVPSSETCTRPQCRLVVMHFPHLGGEEGEAVKRRRQAVPMADAGIAQGHIHEENDSAVAVCRHAPPLAGKGDLSSIADSAARHQYSAADVGGAQAGRQGAERPPEFVKRRW